jgi:flavin reductase (DIM6/NTAB) family NADH-FMN oxidoreductase RutF
MAERTPIDPQAALRLLTPGPAALLGAAYRGRVGLMAVSWLAPAGFAPPMVVVAVHPARFTHDLVRRSASFSLSFPGRPQLEALERAGALSGHDVDGKPEALGLACEPGDVTGAPLVVGFPAALECSLVEATAPGDHTLFVGLVEHAEAVPAAFDRGWTLADEEVTPVAHLGGSTFALYRGPIGAATTPEEG